MNAEEVIAIIKKRRDEFWDRQIGASTEDPDGGAAAQRAREIADEYDDLLAEIEGASR